MINWSTPMFLSAKSPWSDPRPLARELRPPLRAEGHGDARPVICARCRTDLPANYSGPLCWPCYDTVRRRILPEGRAWAEQWVNAEQAAEIEEHARLCLEEP